MWSIVGLILAAALVVTIIFVMVFVFNLTRPVLSLIVRVIQAIGRTVLKLIADVTVAAVCVVKAVVLLVVAMGALLLGRWSSARRTGASVRALFKRAGCRLSDLPTRAAAGVVVPTTHGDPDGKASRELAMSGKRRPWPPRCRALRPATPMPATRSLDSKSRVRVLSMQGQRG